MKTVFPLLLVGCLGLCGAELIIESGFDDSTTTTATAPYYLLQPADFRGVLGEDAPWALDNIPLFEAANATLQEVYYFRWRSFKSHIHPTGRDPADGIDWVITEFSPNVGWAGKYNTINCAAGHHMTEGGWLRNRSVTDSYSRWWTTDEARHNYYYWWATAARRNYGKSGDAALLRATVPAYKAQFLQYARGQLPAANAGFSAEHDCLWNAPGNEGQENSLSGDGCRTLVQSMMFGEADALAELCAAIGDAAGEAEMGAEAARWQRRVLRLWNANLSSFDTLRFAYSPPPGPPPPPPGPPPPGFTRLPSHDMTFCCDQARIAKP